MKKRWWIILIVVALVIIIPTAICLNTVGTSESSFTIKVTGDSGLSFSGSYMVVKSNGQVTSKSVDGYTGDEYSVTGMTVSATFQKQQTDGLLEVDIYKGNDLVVSSNTTAAYGVVSIATP